MSTLINGTSLGNLLIVTGSFILLLLGLSWQLFSKHEKKKLQRILMMLKIHVKMLRF
jgi:hypothetical protein